MQTKINKVKYVIISVLAILFIVSCKERPPKVSHIEVDFKLVPFYENLFSIEPDTETINRQKQRLINEYGDYLQAYSMKIVGSGSVDDEYFADNMAQFLSYEANQEVVDTCKKVFNNLNELENEIKRAFQYYKYYFPEKIIPGVYLHISGFNQAIVIDSAWVSVSVENYLGNDCVFYEWLEIYQYLRKKMIPEKVVPDIMKAIAMTEFIYNDSIDDLLSRMIYNGMIVYFVKKTNPYLNDVYLFDFTQDELKWCKQYERNMWATLVEQKHLYSTDRIVMQKYVNDAPFTFYFGQDSPGRTGIYLGYKIILSYLKRNPGTTLSQLMEKGDYHKFFISSGYRP
jgi:hypothetical protein